MIPERARARGFRVGTIVRRAVRLACVPLVLAALSGCLPIPDVRIPIAVDAPTYRIAPERVRTSFETVPGAQVTGTPDHLNQSYVLRYHVRAEPDTILVLVPGLFGGATSMDPLARQLVAAIPGLEVWAVDRRANGLEDRSAFRRAIEASDPDIAFEYYVEQRGRPGGFQPWRPEDLGFMSRWGLAAHLEDLDAVVQLARQRAERVVLGGHSLGASLASLYASYRRDAFLDVGENHLDGLVLIDGTLGRTGAFRIGDALAGPLGTQFLPTATDVRQGRFPPFLTTVVTPESTVERAVVAQLAWYDPSGPAPERLAKYPMTNLALAGSMFDDQTHVLPIFAVSVGHAVGAVLHGNLPAFMLTGRFGASSQSIAGVEPGVERITWSAGDPAVEATDLRSFLRAWTYLETDRNEWYFPLLLLLEAADLDAGLLDRSDFRPTAEVTVPTIAFGAERGLVSDLNGFSTYLNLRYGSAIAAYVVPQYTHIDIVTAADNPVVGILARWLERLPPPTGAR